MSEQYGDTYERANGPWGNGMSAWKRSSDVVVVTDIEAIARLERHVAELVGQRDKLLAAFKEAECGIHGDSTMTETERLELIRSAIAAAKGDSK